jgi:NADPH2:quinone reductase
LSPRGWFVSFGNASGPIPAFEPLTLTQKGSLIFTRPSLMHYVPNREAFVNMSNKVFDLVKQGKVKVNIHKTFPLSEAKQAHLEIQGAKALGKILLKVLRQI